jgi:hypothetical protein
MTGPADHEYASPGAPGFAFQNLTARHDPIEAGLVVRRHAKRVALGRRQILRRVG